MTEPVASTASRAPSDFRPDALAEGFAAAAPDPLRYDKQIDDPYESTGIILRMLPIGSRVLDVGCGTGSISCLMRDVRQCSVIGLEPDLARSDLARQRGIQTLTDILRPELQPTLGQFDAVTFTDVLEHLPDPASVLRVARAFLKPGGIVVASVPNIAHWSVRANLLRGNFDYSPSGIMDATHLRWFTRRTFRHLFQSQGFLVPDPIQPSAGTWMSVYHSNPLLRRIPQRDRLVRLMTGCFPALFGCQWVIKGIAP